MYDAGYVLLLSRTFVICALVTLICRGVLCQRQTRVADVSFSPLMKILDRNVTCGTHIPGKFAAPTWSCHDLRVDDRRLIFTYFPGPGASKIECGDELGRNDIAQLCRHLLETHGVKHRLWSAYISKASCHRSDSPRIYYVKRQDGSYYWDEEETGKGYIISLQCMVHD